MRRAILRRDRSGDQGTVGVLVANGLAPVQIMEPPWRDNARNRSCIPPGAYEVLPHISPRFGRCLLVTCVPDRSHILFHAGNLGGDVDKRFRSHTAGCLLPGLRRGWIRVPERGPAQAGEHRQDAVLGSRTATRHLFSWAGHGPFRLEIVHA